MLLAFPGTGSGAPAPAGPKPTLYSASPRRARGWRARRQTQATFPRCPLDLISKFKQAGVSRSGLRGLPALRVRTWSWACQIRVLQGPGSALTKHQGASPKVVARCEPSAESLGDTPRRYSICPPVSAPSWGQPSVCKAQPERCSVQPGQAGGCPHARRGPPHLGTNARRHLGPSCTSLPGTLRPREGRRGQIRKPIRAQQEEGTPAPTAPPRHAWGTPTTSACRTWKSPSGRWQRPWSHPPVSCTSLVRSLTHGLSPPGP